MRRLSRGIAGSPLSGRQVLDEVTTRRDLRFNTLAEYAGREARGLTASALRAGGYAKAAMVPAAKIEYYSIKQ